MPAENWLISRQQVLMPAIIYGTAWKKQHTAKLVEQAINAGFRGIDTACQPKHYNEAGVGEGISACLTSGIVTRADLYIQSKFTPINGQDPLQIPYDATAKLSEQVAQSFLTSQKNLQIDNLDGLILHSPLPERSHFMEVWEAMQKIFDKQAVKQLGISNCYDLATLEFLYDKAETKPAILQNRFYADSQYDRQIRVFCKERGIIYQSFWTLTANPGVLANAILKTMAKKYGCQCPQIFFRFLTQLGVIPLTGTTSLTHMREDLAIFDFKLTDEECASINALLGPPI